MHTNVSIVPFRAGTPDKRKDAPGNNPSAFDFTTEAHAAAIFGAFSFESLCSGARGVELKTYSPRRCAPVAIVPAPKSLAVEALMADLRNVDGEAF